MREEVEEEDDEEEKEGRKQEGREDRTRPSCVALRRQLDSGHKSIDNITYYP